MIIFAGVASGCLDSISSLCNDVWELSNANGLGGIPGWAQLLPAGPAESCADGVTASGPCPRHRSTSIYDIQSTRMIVFGGVFCCVSVSFFNDVWVLTLPPHTTSTVVSPNPSTVIIGNTITFTATVTDTGTGTVSSPAGTVTWSDGGAGGTFSASGVCTLSPSSSSSSTCSITYAPPTSSGTETITAVYSGDSTHASSSGSSSLTVQTPQQAITSLKGQVSSLGPPTGPLNSGQVNSLLVKLNQAIANLNAGKKTPACNQLQAFINEVQSLISNGVLTAAQGDPLISQAQAIRSAVPC